MKGVSLLDKFLSGLLVLLVLALAYSAFDSISSYMRMYNAERQRIGQQYCAPDDNACLDYNCISGYSEPFYVEQCKQSLITSEYTSQDFTAWQISIFFDVYIGELNSFLTLTASVIFTAIVKWLVGLVRKGAGVLSLRALRKAKIYGAAITSLAIFLSLIVPVIFIVQAIIENWGGRIPMFPYFSEASRKLDLFNLNVEMMLIGIVLIVFAYALEKMLVYKAEVDLTI